MVTGSVSAFLALVMFLIVFMGLQVSTSFVSSRITATLSILPLSRQDVSTIVFMCFIRIFDLPLISAIVVLFSITLLVGGSILGSLTSLIAIVTTEFFALALTIGLAKFFYSRVAGGGGRSKWKIALRFVYVIIWVLPTFGTYFVINFATRIVESFSSIASSLSSSIQFLVLLYPFSLGFLVSSAMFLGTADPFILGLAAASSIGYVALALYSFRWVTHVIRGLGNEAVSSGAKKEAKDTLIHPCRPSLGIIRKDLRIASRSPSYASLFLLPALQTAILAITFSSFGEMGFSTTLGVLTGISFVTLMLPPTMFSIESLASVYTRSLPLRKGTLIFAKTALSVITYLISLVTLTVVASYLGKNFTYILSFGLVYTFSVAAAFLLELVILANRFWSEGFAMGNVYAKLSSFILILLPAYLVAWTPIIVAFVSYFLVADWVLAVFSVVSLSEFVTLAFVAFRRETTEKTSRDIRP
ncbi:hypothetical protein MUP01_01235 [Candidatus Bathyarchaeota archaeon]|nr:hypothetical protein [Candidatus Bathyarchaeota archaeon]